VAVKLQFSYDPVLLNGIIAQNTSMTLVIPVNDGINTPPECSNTEVLRFVNGAWACIPNGIPDCTDVGFALNYNATTGQFRCLPTWNIGSQWWYAGDSRAVCPACDVCTDPNLQTFAFCPDNWLQRGFATCGPISNPNSAQRVGVLCRAPSADVF